MRAIALISIAILISGCTSHHDYVSQYDFSSALLEDLPWEMGAPIVGNNTSFEYLDYVRTNHSDWNYVQYHIGRQMMDDLEYGTVVNDPADIVPQYDSVDSDSCRLVDGKLWHHLCITNGVVTTETDRRFQLEVVPIRYDDFNNDGYMDVLIHRFLPGSASPKGELVLSRKQPVGKFHVVEIGHSWFRRMEEETGVKPPDPKWE
ncbi:hypothetical protein PDESU_00409 [Pontiella desulfatans]|uniref:Lipoprotein n=1 Tax=Pontiella desulfatans TaxID=2750659 RepID=A0A6C2TWE4_PONDE|nr:hypothetical protein [Pontiella desulfatans]VGO11862.1 hypothetical protein PDESU_00409 [Pontiella desulfatans]